MQQQSKQGSILIVDDTQENIDVLVNLLRQDFDIRVAISGELALDFISDDYKPDLILLDVYMPGIDGYEVCSRLKENPQYTNIPVLFISATNDVQDRLKGFRVGGVDFISKPFQAEEVLARVEAHLGLRRAKKELQEMNATLEKRVEERTQELYRLNTSLEFARNRMEVAMNKALDSSRAKSQFLANMSHEIRTPLNAIIGYSDVLSVDGNLNDRQYKLIKTVKKNGQHLLNVINDILDLSKIEAGRMDIERVEVNLYELMSELESSFVLKCREKSLDFKIDYAFPLPLTFLGDPTRIKQILFNLVGNAIKFTSKGSVTIQVECIQKHFLQIKVIDTGIGIPYHKQKELFTTFQQADNSVARKYGGTGLGLYISLQLAKKMGGDVKLRSEPEKGTELTTTIDISYQIGEMCNDFNALKHIDDENIKPQDIKDKTKILYAEDLEENQELLRLLLAQANVHIDTVENGQMAIDAASSTAYDLILMDIQMPVLDGVGATLALREKGIKTPIIALTANVMTEDIKKYNSSGFDGYLSKPIDKNNLYKMVSKYQPATSDKPVQNIPRVIRTNIKVLLVEDEEDLADITRIQLIRNGFDVSVAYNGRDAVSQTLTNYFDVVIMDINLPTLNGIEAIKEIRFARNQTPILAISGGDHEGLVINEKAMIEHGFDGYFQKPVAVETLSELIEKYYQQSQEQEPPRKPKENQQPRMMETDPDLAEIVDRYRTRLLSIYNSVLEAYENKNWDKMRVLVHDMKGSAGSLGFIKLYEMTLILQQFMGNDDFENITPNHLNSLKDICVSIAKGGEG